MTVDSETHDNQDLSSLSGLDQTRVKKGLKCGYPWRVQCGAGNSPGLFVVVPPSPTGDEIAHQQCDTYGL